MEYRNLGKAGVTMSWPERAAGGSAISTPLRLRVCWPKSHPAGPQGLVDILVGDRALAPAAVGAMVTGDDGRAVRQTPGGSGGASPASLHGWRVLGAAGRVNAHPPYVAGSQWFRSSRSPSAAARCQSGYAH